MVGEYLKYDLLCRELKWSERNLALSLAAGNATLWKPSQTTPLCAIAVTKIISEVLERNSLPGAIAGLVIGGKDVGEAVVESRDVDMGTYISDPHSVRRRISHNFFS